PSAASSSAPRQGRGASAAAVAVSVFMGRGARCDAGIVWLHPRVFGRRAALPPQSLWHFYGAIAARQCYPARRMRPVAEPPPPPPAHRWTAHAAAAATSVAVTLAALPLRDVLDPANTVMLYLLATVGVALRWGRGPAA